MVTSSSPEQILELAINESALDDILSQRERKQILKALQAVDIAADELIDYSFYFADQLFREEHRRVSNWLRDFVLFARHAELPAPFLAKGVWFSPGSSIRTVLLNSIRSAQRSIDVCVYNFTDDRIANALTMAMDRGVHVTVLTERSSMTCRGSVVSKLRNKGATTFVVDRSGTRLMHNKFAIIDDRYVLSGSYNYTNAALKNDENLNLISHAANVRDYIEHFRKLIVRCTNTK